MFLQFSFSSLFLRLIDLKLIKKTGTYTKARQLLTMARNWIFIPANIKIQIYTCKEQAGRHLSDNRSTYAQQPFLLLIMNENELNVKSISFRRNVYECVVWIAGNLSWICISTAKPPFESIKFINRAHFICFIQMFYRTLNIKYWTVT